MVIQDPNALRYVAFLRAINVGGRVVKMTALKAVFERLELAEVETFIASGNVIFSSAAESPKLESLIERALRKALGYEVATFLRTTAEIAAIAKRDPFGVPVPAGGRIYVGFLRDKPAAAARRKVAELATKTDWLAVEGREIWWLCATPSVESAISGATFERVLGQPATLRNLNTVKRLAEK